MKKKKRLRVLIIIAGVILTLAISLIVWRGINRRVYSAFFSFVDEVCKVPAHLDFVPQGITVMDGEEFLISGYTPMGLKASSVYYIHSQDGKHTDDSHRCYLLNADGSKNKVHCGGIAISGEYVIASGSGCLWVYMLEDILQKNEARLVCCLDIPGFASTISISGEDIFTADWCTGPIHRYGQFYKSEDGYSYNSKIYRFALSEALGYIEEAAETANGPTYVLDPTYGFLVKDGVQGVTSADGYLLTVSSIFISPSRIDIYKLPDKESFEDNAIYTQDIIDGELPLVILDEDDRVVKFYCPMMMESAAHYNGKIYTFSESGAPLYLGSGRLLGYEFIYRFDLGERTEIED